MRLPFAARCTADIVTLAQATDAPSLCPSKPTAWCQAVTRCRELPDHLYKHACGHALQERYVPPRLLVQWDKSGQYLPPPSCERGCIAGGNAANTAVQRVDFANQSLLTCFVFGGSWGVRNWSRSCYCDAVPFRLQRLKLLLRDGQRCLVCTVAAFRVLRTACGTLTNWHSTFPLYQRWRLLACLPVYP